MAYYSMKNRYASLANKFKSDIAIMKLMEYIK